MKTTMQRFFAWMRKEWRDQRAITIGIGLAVPGLTGLAYWAFGERIGAAPPANSSPFMVMLRPEPTLVGQATVLGQVSEGLDVVRRLSRVPSNQQVTRPYFKPLKPLEMVSVTIVEKPSAGATPAGGS